MKSLPNAIRRKIEADWHERQSVLAILRMVREQKKAEKRA